MGMWARMFKRGAPPTSASTAVTPAPAGGERPRATVTLRPMTQPEFDRFKAFIYDDYAAAISRGMGVPIEEVREQAIKQTDELLKDGLASETHRLWKILSAASPEGEVVGDLWVNIEVANQRAFIYFIGIDEAQRGKGYARAAMLALEEVVKPEGIGQIGLNVFGDNLTARHLYESLGYQPSAISMRKEI